MPRPRKIAYEKFAEFAASGLSLAESYRRTTGQTKNADVKGTQWHGYAGIKERIAELKEQNARRAQLTRDELLAFYAEVIRTPADQVPPGSPVIQTYEQDGEGHVKLRICDKAAAGAALVKDVRLELGRAARRWRQYPHLLSAGASGATAFRRTGVID